MKCKTDITFVKAICISGLVLAASWILGAQSAVAEEEHGPEEAEKSKVVYLSEEQQERFGIRIGNVERAKIGVQTRLTGEVHFNLDRLSHVVSRVPGVISEVKKTFGDQVHAGEVMAVLESRELAEATAAFLTARARLRLAQVHFAREERLWQEQISSEREYLNVQQKLAEARIAHQAAEQKLHALGLEDTYLAQLSDDPENIGRYELKAPFAGTVTDKHVVIGEVLSENTQAFVVADLSTVWVELNVYLKDLARIREGQAVLVRVGQGIPDGKGEIGYISPAIDEGTRTAMARVELDNTTGVWRPGMLVSAWVSEEEMEVSVAVPKTAIQEIEEKTCVFVETEEGFVPQPVILGRSDETHTEIVGGLKTGDRVVTESSLYVKSALLSAQLGGHQHGH